MSEKEFLRMLGQPVGLSFRLDDGKLLHTMTGYPQELFSDHGVDVYGTRNDGLIEMGQIKLSQGGVRFAFGRILIQALARGGCIDRTGEANPFPRGGEGTDRSLQAFAASSN